ncbi:MAG: hypothetical protein ACPGVK_01095 [Halocynthiibacter sp.]
MQKELDDLNRFIRSQVDATDARVTRLEFNSRVIWLKQPEQLNLRFRLQKGDSTRAFNAERTALKTLKSHGVPIPQIIAEGPDFIALGDSGTPLNQIIGNEDYSKAERIEIFTKAGQALAMLHQKGLSHGRPALKDLCWDGQQITFLDFERFSEKRNTPHGHAQDVVMFVFNTYAVAGRDCAELTAAIAAYRSHDTMGIWSRAQKWCANKGWINWLTKPIQMRRAGKAKEFKAIPLTLQLFNRPRP